MNNVILVLYIVSALVLSYLLGSISFAVIIAKKFTNKDIREVGSGNAGMTNVMRAVGAKAGLITFVLDFLKGVVACLIAKYGVFEFLQKTGFDWLSPTYWGYICGFFCLLGHLYPVFFKFKGGKGVATTGGIMLACSPITLLIGAGVFLIVFLITRTVSVSSISAGIGLITAIIFFYEQNGLPNTRLIQIVLVVLLVGLVIIKHRDNIDRIAKGEEKPLEVKKEEN